MPEPLPPGLPPRISPPSAPQRSFAAAIGTAASRRRRRFAGVSGTALALLLTATAVTLLPTDAGGDRLSVAESGALDASAAPGSPAPEQSQPPATSAPAAPTPEPDESEEPTAAPAPQEPGPQQTAEAERPDEEPEPSAAPPAPAAEPEVGPPSEVVAMRSGQSCDGSGPTPAQGWCSYYDGALQGRSGETVVLATNVCRLPGQAAGRLTTPDGEHTRFAVGRQSTSTPVWDWRTGRRFRPEATTFVVDAGRCVRWFVSWNVTGNAGQALAPGEYYLEALPRVRQDAAGDAYLDTTQTFTVTS